MSSMSKWQEMVEQEVQGAKAKQDEAMFEQQASSVRAAELDLGFVVETSEEEKQEDDDKLNLEALKDVAQLAGFENAEIASAEMSASTTIPKPPGLPEKGVSEVMVAQAAGQYAGNALRKSAEADSASSMKLVPQMAG